MDLWRVGCYVVPMAEQVVKSLGDRGSQESLSDASDATDMIASLPEKMKFPLSLKPLLTPFPLLMTTSVENVGCSFQFFVFFFFLLLHLYTSVLNTYY